MSDMWHFILSSEYPTYHNFVSTATDGWNMVPVRTKRPRACSAPGPRSLECVTYLSCGGARPNALAGTSDKGRVSTETGATSGSGHSSGHTRRGRATAPHPDWNGHQAAEKAAT